MLECERYKDEECEGCRMYVDGKCIQVHMTADEEEEEDI